MSKKRKTVSLDPEVKAYLDANGRNASETVNELVKMEMGEEVVNKQLIKMRMEMEKDRYEDAAQKARGHLERYNGLKEQLEAIEEEEESQLEEAMQVLESVPWKEDNNAIQQWAEDLEMDECDLINQLEDYHAQ